MYFPQVCFNDVLLQDSGWRKRVEKGSFLWSDTFGKCYTVHLTQESNRSHGYILSSKKSQINKSIVLSGKEYKFRS